MKAIEILSNGRQVQFTTKSVTIAGKEYLYSHITELRHSEGKQIYGFKCDGDVVMLPYEEKDAQVLKVIFSQVQQMHRKPAAAAPAKAGQAEAAATGAEAPVEVPAEAPVEAPVEAPGAEVAAEAPAEAIVPEVTAETTVEAPGAEVADEAAAAEAAAEVADEAAAAEAVTEAAGTEPAAEEAPAEGAAAEFAALSPKEKKRLEKEQRKADKEAAKREKKEQKAAAKTGGEEVTYTESATGQIDPEQKSARLKKALIIFAVILAIFVLLGVAYYFFIGPSSDPQIGPNTDQTQYNDIDDMINDLED